MIDHNLLLRKLALYGMSDCVMDLFSSYLSNRQQCVSVDAHTSSLSTLMYGIPQGSILGPILFSLDTNDLPLCIKALCELFADDTSLNNHHTDLNTLHASLQNSLDNLIDWTEMKHMALHPDKTKFMLITTRQKRQNIVSYFHPLTVQGITIEEVQKHRVLGVTIDNNLSWTPHVNSLCKKISIKTFQLSKIKHFINFHARKFFSHAHIQSLIDYGSTLSDSASKNSLKPLHSLYKRSLKLILLKRSSLDQDNFNLLNILPLHAKLKYDKGIYMQKIMSGNAPPSVTRLFPPFLLQRTH